jgi:hypothetical protein
MVNKMSELKRCPFCGGEAELACRDFGSWFVRCKKCFCKTPIFLTERFATISWNTRKPMERIVERLEEQAKQYNRRANELVEKSTEAGIHNKGKACSYEHAIEIVKEEGGMNE